MEDHTADIKKFRETVSGRELFTFDELDTNPKHINGNFLREMDLILEKGWERNGSLLPSFSPPIQWGGFDRSAAFHLHAWEPVSFLLKASCIAPDPAERARYFDACFGFVMDWLERFQVPVLDREPEFALAKENQQPGLPIWYDMAVGQRVYRLAFMLDVMCRDEKYPDSVIALFVRSIAFHHRMLMVDGFFKEHSNHGIYQALGQLAASKRFMDIDEEAAAYFDIASNRLMALLDEHFTPDNVHKEHSPGYHYMVLGSLVGAAQTQLLRTDIGNRVLAMEEALTWMIRPDFWIAALGDSDPKRIFKYSYPERLAERFATSGLQAVITRGEMGTLPSPGVKPYYDAGYAFARLYAPDVEQKFGNASYLAQIAAFHSRVHKHADHLGFIWFDRGRDILIDPGRYAYAGRTETGSDLFNQGFWYADPKRIYVESTRAHNCVEIDGKSYPRRGVKPFGSALRHAGEQNGLAVTDCELTHQRTVRHRRVLVMAPGHFLFVLDWLNDRGGAHDYRQWFQFAPEWKLEQADDKIIAIIARAPARDMMESDDESAGSGSRADSAQSADPALTADALSMFNLLDENALGAPVRGQEEPELQGWMSDAAYSLVPCTSIAVEATKRQMARFATLFAFGDDVALDGGRTRFNASMRNGTVCWSDGRGRHTLTLTLGDPGNVSAVLATKPH
jgi:hypothetical protein